MVLLVSSSPVDQNVETNAEVREMQELIDRYNIIVKGFEGTYVSAVLDLSVSANHKMAVFAYHVDL